MDFFTRADATACSSLVRCFGPLFMAASTARSKRSHASGSTSISFFAMPRRPRELPVTVKLPSFLLREIGRCWGDIGRARQGHSPAEPGAESLFVADHIFSADRLRSHNETRKKVAHVYPRTGRWTLNH
jgi:hypothetical protein